MATFLRIVNALAHLPRTSAGRRGWLGGPEDVETAAKYASLVSPTFTMEWATRSRIRISRAATAWLIGRFVDAEATFYFGTNEEVLARQQQGAIGFHVKGSRYPKSNGGLSPFEALVQRHRPDDLALRRFAEIVRDADGPVGEEEWPEAIGLRIMTVALPDACANDEECTSHFEKS